MSEIKINKKKRRNKSKVCQIARETMEEDENEQNSEEKKYSEEKRRRTKLKNIKEHKTKRTEPFFISFLFPLLFMCKEKRHLPIDWHSNIEYSMFGFI